MYTDKKNENFLICEKIQIGSVAVAVIYEEGLPNTVYEKMRKYLTIYEEAVSHK